MSSVTNVKSSPAISFSCGQESQTEGQLFKLPNSVAMSILQFLPPNDIYEMYSNYSFSCSLIESHRNLSSQLDFGKFASESINKSDKLSSIVSVDQLITEVFKFDVETAKSLSKAFQWDPLSGLKDHDHGLLHFAMTNPQDCYRHVMHELGQLRQDLDADRRNDYNIIAYGYVRVAKFLHQENIKQSLDIINAVLKLKNQPMPLIYYELMTEIASFAWEPVQKYLFLLFDDDPVENPEEECVLNFCKIKVLCATAFYSNNFQAIKKVLNDRPGLLKFDMINLSKYEKQLPIILRETFNIANFQIKSKKIPLPFNSIALAIHLANMSSMSSEDFLEQYSSIILGRSPGEREKQFCQTIEELRNSNVETLSKILDEEAVKYHQDRWFSVQKDIKDIFEMDDFMQETRKQS